MATPHEDIKPPTLEFAYRLEFQVGDPVIVPSGPKGSRYLFPVLAGGTFEGADPDFHGTISMPSVDFAVGHSDGSGVTLKVNFILTTHDGATILGIVEGRSKRDPNNPVNSDIHSAKTFETGDERYKWMNNEVFVGSGVKLDKKIKVNYYRQVKAKSMVTLSTMFVLSDYLSSENDQDIYGELRVSGVQIRSVPSNLLCCGRFVVQNVPKTGAI